MISSSWIESVKYKRLPDGSSYLAVFLKEGGFGGPKALLYGPKLPSWLPGLLAAGTGKRSVGTAYNRLLKGKYSYQRVEGKDKIRELKEMFQ